MQWYTYSQVFEESVKYFEGDEFAAKVFVDKYALQNSNGEYLELTPKDMHHRLAKEFARIEQKYPNPMSESEIFSLLDRFKYIVPQGSPMYGIGNNHYVQSLGNCFVVDSPYDSYGGICKSDQELAQLMKRRAGVGLDISNIRPKGLSTANAAKTTDGIGIFMERFSNTCREVAQCLGKDTLILTVNGLKKISEIEIGDEVWTNQKWIPVEKILKNKKKVVKLITESGKEILASKDHIFHTINGEKKINQLSIDDSITQIIGNGWNGKDIKLKATEYQQIGKNKSNRLHKNITLPSVLNKNMAYILGQMYGDGFVMKNKGIDNGVSIALSDDWGLITNKLLDFTKKTFNLNMLIRNKKGEKCSDGKIFSRELVLYLKENNLLKQKSNEIIFPSQLLKAKPDVLFSFISGYFDADGCVQKSKKQYKINSIQKDFLLTIQNIFMSFGIFSKIHKEVKSNKIGQENWKDLYSLTINGELSQNNFRQLMSESVKISQTSFDSKNRDLTKSIYNISDLNSKAGRHSFIIDNKQYLSYSSLNKAKCELNNNDCNFLFQDHVKEIIEQEVEEDVYDLVLGKEHLFFANGLYAHNSGRRGALMESISINHPEVETFISIKQNLKKVTGANISVRLTDEFMNAVKNDEDFTLRWPVDSKTPIITNKVKSKKIWDAIINSAWASAEPGILFWDKIIDNSPADIYANKYPNFKTQSTNPCGELPLGLDSCRLLVINLLSFVNKPFTKEAEFDYDLYSNICQKAQRLMDDLIDLEIEKIDKIIKKINSDPEPESIKLIELNMWNQFLTSCKMGRRTGTGITALGDCLAAMNIKYGSEQSIEVTGKIYQQLMINAYKSSCIMAGERGAFPIFDANLEKDHPFISLGLSLDEDLKNLYNKNGRRNVALLTTAPAGSVSSLTRTTSGIEPVYMTNYTRRKKHNPSDKNARIDFTDAMGDQWQEFTVYHNGVTKWMEVSGETDISKSPYAGATAVEIDWVASVDLQAEAQKYVDHSISKTCNLPEDVSKEVVSQVYMRAWEKGCKGFTVYRDKCRDGVLISSSENKKDNEERPADINIIMAPKRPAELPCEIKKVKINGEAWTFFVGIYNNKPYELFGGLSKYVDIPNKNKNGTIVKNGKVDGITSYNLIVGEGDDQMLIKNIANVFENHNFGAFTRTISLALRHGTPVQYVVEQLLKDKYSDITSFSKVAARVLKSYIADGTKTSIEKKCPECGSENSFIYEDKCVKCKNCPYSKC